MSKKNERVRKVPVALVTGTTKAGVWLGSIRLSGFSLLIMALTLLGVLILAPQFQILIEQRQEISDLQAQAKAQQEDLEQLEKDRARWDDPAYVRAQARDRLYYVMPGEISYLVFDDGAQIDAIKREQATASLQNTNTDWVSGLLKSFLIAGLGTPTPDQVQPTP
jgi:cell division protein FtsB